MPPPPPSLPCPPPSIVVCRKNFSFFGHLFFLVEMKTFRIGGVPEHYNAPFHTALSVFEDPEYEYEWVNYPSGTGALLESVLCGELDSAVVLAEGAVSRIINKGDVEIVGTFVSSPLVWGVHVSLNSHFTSVSDISKNDSPNPVRIGISRFGSGSHIMAEIMMEQHEKTYVVINTMSGAAEAMQAGLIDVFLWDIPTAACHSNVWKCVGTVCGEWPAFVFVQAKQATHSPDILIRLMTQVRNHAILLKEEEEFAIQFLCDKFRITQNQSAQFLKSVAWTSSPSVSRSALQRVMHALSQAKVIPAKVSAESLAVHCSFLS